MSFKNNNHVHIFFELLGEKVLSYSDLQTIKISVEALTNIKTFHEQVVCFLIFDMDNPVIHIFTVL